MSYSPREPDVAPADPENRVPAGHGEGTSHIEPDDIGVGMLTVLFAFVAVVVLLVVVLLQAWFYNWKVEVLARSRDEYVEQTPAAIAQEQLQRIETYGWADPKTKKGRAIPISRAMELVARELAAEKESGGK